MFAVYHNETQPHHRDVIWPHEGGETFQIATFKIELGRGVHLKEEVI